MEKLKASDLRIGNLVYDSTGNTTIIESIVPEHERVRFGIPLTEEWLVKFGFERIESEHDLGFEIKHKERSKFVFVRTKCYNPLIENFFCVFNHSECSPIELQFLRKVERVDQLQNIYHALTGEELTIK